MAANGEKTQAGSAGKRTVLQLEPAKYQITLLYLGHDRIKHDATKYRCKYELQDGETTIAAKPHTIPNIVRGNNEANDEHAVTTATPGQNADPINPPNDKKYRVMITDNHGMRSKDSNLLGRPQGDTESKPDNYEKVDGAEKKNWMPDIEPAVPFRVVVRKLFGNTPVDLEDSHHATDLKAVFEIKDPVEEFDQNVGSRRRFLEGTPAAPGTPAVEGFFTKYNREDKNPDPGDDNALGIPKDRWFKGIRLPSHGEPGVKAVDVLKKVEYTDPPKIDEAPEGESGTNNVPYAKLSAATDHERMNAKFDVTTKGKDGNDLKDENGVRVGVADLAFCPWPAGGDNYRFLITLLDSKDKDVRDEHNLENGVPAKLVDHAKEEIPGKTEDAEARAYTTGRFIIWKRLKMKLVVLVNRTTRADINWNTVRNFYRRDFLEVVPPDDPGGYYNLVPTQWIAELKNVFPSPADVAGLDAITTAAAPNDLEAVYRRNFFPKFLSDKYPDRPAVAGATALMPNMTPLTRSIVTHTCTNVIPALQSPDSTNGKKQEDSEGFFLMLVRRPSPTVTGMGAAFGDRMFWFVNRASTVPGRASTSSTCAHEMGHALFLRHAHTSRVSATYQDSAAPPVVTAIQLVDARRNNQIHDHDQADAFACLMSYTRPLTAEPCGVCALTVRFYDRVAIQRAGRHQNQIMSGLSPVTIVRLTTLAGAPRLSETIPNRTLAAGASHAMTLMAVGRQITYTTRSGSVLQGRVNVTGADDNPRGLWSKAGAGDVTLSIVGGNKLRVIATRVGAVTITYQKSGLTATANFNVT